MRHRRSLSIVAAVALLAPATSAVAQPTNKTRAVRAVRAEIEDRYSGFHDPYVECTTLTSRRFKCTYVGLDRRLKVCRGTARATIYASAVDVTLSHYRCDT